MQAQQSQPPLQQTVHKVFPTSLINSTGTFSQTEAQQLANNMPFDVANSFLQSQNNQDNSTIMSKQSYIKTCKDYKPPELGLDQNDRFSLSNLDTTGV